jgi:hypothetical protein
VAGVLEIVIGAGAELVDVPDAGTEATPGWMVFDLKVGALPEIAGAIAGTTA